MPNVSAIILVLAALWASVSAKASMFAVVNERRDTILIGQLNNVPISLEHRRLIYERDWKPIAGGTVIISWLFAVVVIFIPYLIADSDGTVVLTGLCYAVAVYNALAGFATVRSLVAEQRYLKRFLESLADGAMQTAVIARDEPQGIEL